MSYPLYHGIELALNAQIHNLVFETRAADPASGELTAGRQWYNSTDNVFRMCVIDGNGVLQVRTYTTKEALDVERARIATLEADTLYADGRRAMSGDLDMGGTNVVTNLAAPVNDSDAANKLYIDDKFASLGHAFEYCGSITPGADASTAFDADTLTQKNAGDYYKIVGNGYVKIGTAAAFYVNAGDSLVWNPNGGLDKFDNTNSEVYGTANFVALSGSTDTGFTVDIDQDFKDRMTTVETRADAMDSLVAASQSATGIASDGSYVPSAGANYIATAASVHDATVKLDAALKTTSDALATETSRATNAETAIDNRLTTVEGQVNGNIGDKSQLTTDDKTNLVAAINEVDAEKDSNKVASEDRDSTIRTALGIDAAGAWSKGVINTSLNPADVSTALSNVETAVTDGQTSLNNRVNDLLQSINSKIYKYQSSSAALAHNFAHNLGSTDLNVQVWVQDTSGSWRNDIVPVTVVDDNNIGCLLTQAMQVKILCTAVTAATANAA
jgi:hypothetical protein